MSSTAKKYFYESVHKCNIFVQMSAMIDVQMSAIKVVPFRRSCEHTGGRHSTQRITQKVERSLRNTANISKAEESNREQLIIFEV